jgi:hypothetical protein
VILFTLSITNFINHKKYISYKSSLKKSDELVYEYKNKIVKLTSQLKENNSTKKADDTILINQACTNFLNAFLNYDALSKDKIYDNIKPYSTEYLTAKLKTVKQNDLASDVNFKVSISNIRMYTKSLKDSKDTSILVMAEEGIDTNSSSTKSSILIELSLKKINDKWLVDDININTPLNNQQLLN